MSWKLKKYSRIVGVVSAMALVGHKPKAIVCNSSERRWVVVI